MPWLADEFEKLRTSNLEKYGLCPSHYLRLLSLSWDAMPKIIKVEL